MTIEVKITNEDNRSDAVISVQEIMGDSPDSKLCCSLKGGESKTVYLHSGKELTIKEVSDT